MSDSFAGVVLGAGSGERMRPLSDDLPKVMCPVGTRPLVDWNLSRIWTATDDVTVNVSHMGDLLARHIGDRCRISDETDHAMGTAGALARMRSWIDGRPTIVLNGDTWCPGDLDSLVAAWNGTCTTVMVSGPGSLRPGVGVAAAVIPWSEVTRFDDRRPTGLYEASWRREMAENRLVTVNHHGPFVDCGTPTAYLKANMWAVREGLSPVSPARSVVAPSADVRGTVTDSVVWAGATVGPTENLVSAVRTPSRTVMIRSRGARR